MVRHSFTKLVRWIFSYLIWVSRFFLSLIWLCWDCCVSDLIVLGLLCFWDFLNFFLGSFGNGWETWDLKFFWFINRVLGGCHVEKMPRGKNATSDVIRPWKSSLETRFIAQNWVSHTRDASKKYSFETMLTNYIVWKMGSIPNFGLNTYINTTKAKVSLIIHCPSFGGWKWG